MGKCSFFAPKTCSFLAQWTFDSAMLNFYPCRERIYISLPIMYEQAAHFGGTYKLKSNSTHKNRSHLLKNRAHELVEWATRSTRRVLQRSGGHCAAGAYRPDKRGELRVPPKLLPRSAPTIPRPLDSFGRWRGAILDETMLGTQSKSCGVYARTSAGQHNGARALLHPKASTHFHWRRWTVWREWQAQNGVLGWSVRHQTGLFSRF